MKYAVIKTGGKQYRVFEGQILEIEKIDKKPKEKVEFGEVLLFVDEEEKKLGTPLLADLQVIAEVLEQTKGPKIRVSKFKAKARYRLSRGHRQSLTRVKIEKIAVGEKKLKAEKKTTKRTPRKTVKIETKTTPEG